MVLTYHEAEKLFAQLDAAHDEIVLLRARNGDLERWVADFRSKLAEAEKALTDLAPLSLLAERDALAATLARVKVEGDRWANSKNYTSQFAGGLLREALRPLAADDE